MRYAYDLPDEAREGLVPNLRLAAEQPWMGLTAYISNKPYLVIGRTASAFIIEDEAGHRLEVNFDFPWEAPRVETNRIVAASRTEESPFKDAGILSYDRESGEWAIRVGISNMRYPLEDHIAALEERGWKLAEDFDKHDVVVPVHGKCPNCGSDSLSYADDDDDTSLSDGIVSANQDPIVLCHNCHEWCRESELDTGVDDSSDNQHKEDTVETDDKFKAGKVAAAGFSFQGKAYISQNSAQGIAIMPEKQSKEEMAAMIGGLSTPAEQATDFVGEQNKKNQTSFPLYDNPFVYRGGSVHTADTRYLEQFQGGPFIVVAKWLTPEHTVMFHDETPGGRGTDKRLRGFVTQLGGPGSHAFVVAQPLGVPVVIVQNGEDIDRINPGDHLMINGQTGVVEVNGGDPNFVAQDPNAISVDNPVARFAYAGGNGHVEQMVPGQLTGDKGGHQGMMGALMTSGHAQVDPATFNHNISFGYFCDNGTILQDENPIPDQEQFEQWAHAQEAAIGLPQGAVKRINVSAYAPPGMQATGANIDAPDEALKCPECGSHTIEAFHLDHEKGTGEFGCLHCGNAFNQSFRKHAGAELAKGTRITIIHPAKKGIKGSIADHAGVDDNFGDHLYDLLLDNGEEMKKVPEAHFTRIKSSSFDKGAPYPSDSYKNAPDHTPKKQKKDWPEEVNAIYNACMREGNGKGDTKDEKESSCAAIAWAQYNKNDGHPKDSDKNKESRAQPLPEDVLTGVPGGGYEQDNYEGHPVMCYMCGNTRTAALGTPCGTCGYPLMVRRDGPVPSKTWTKSASLEVGNWYTMHSPKYKVPDVIHVKEVTNDGVTASIEGDDKGLFPIHLRHDEIETEGYSFEPYAPVVDSRTGNYFLESTPHIARRNFSAQEQKELVNENMSGKARNFHKLDLEGTHYPKTAESSVNPLEEDLFWL